MNVPHSSVLLFVRISIQQYSSTKARNDGDFRVERDTFLSEYHRHNDCSAIRLVTPAGSISIQQYSSTKARNDGDFRVERETFLSEYHRHNDCSAIRLVTPAGSNMLCAVSTVEERQGRPAAEFGFCISVVLA